MAMISTYLRPAPPNLKRQHPGKQKTSVFRIVLFVLGFFAFSAISLNGWGQLFQQDFSSSTTVANYVSATPSNGQFNAIGTSGAGMVLSINTSGSNKLRFARTGNAGCYSRTTDFSPTPSSLLYRFDLTVSGNSVAQTTAAVWQVGSGFGTANSAEANAQVHSRIGLNWTATAGQFSLRNLVTSTNSANFSGTQTITWAINNSGSSITYKAPDGTYETVANDVADVWIGTTKVFNDIAATTATQTLTDIKFAFTAGTGTVDIDNILIDPIPAIPTANSATSVLCNGFTANWSTVTGVTGYRLDVSTASDFSSFVSGYNDLQISGQSTSSYAVTGLSASTAYYYRVRAEAAYTCGTFTSGNSGTITATTTSCGTPTITVNPTSLSGFSCVSGSASTSQSFTVSGDNLTADVTITAPTDYEVSTDNSSFFASVTATQSGGNVVGEPKNIWVRIKSSASPGTPSGNVTNASSGATTQNVALSGTVYKPEPTNHASSFTCGTTTSSTIPLTWTDASGGTVPDGYLILWNTSGSFSDPVDGTAQADGAGVKNITQGTQTYTATGLTNSTTYYFKIWPYTNSGTNINYKTAATVPTTNCATTAIPTCSGDLIISEYAEGSSNNKYIELYNGTGSSVNLASYEILHYNNGSATPTYTLTLSGTLNHGSTYVIENSSEGLGVSANLSTSSNVMTFNGDDAIALRKNGTTLIDIIGQIGTDPGTEWGTGLTSTADNTLVRKSTITSGDANGSDAFDPSVEWDGYATDAISYLGSHSQTCSVKPEPTNHATAFTCGTTTSSSIQFTFTDAVAGTQAPDAYLVLYNTSGTFSDPVDGTAQADGTGIINVNYGLQTCTVSGLNPSTTYYFKIWSYTNTGSNINYKTGGTPLTGNCTTAEGPCLSESFESGIPVDWTNGSVVQEATGGCDGTDRVIFDDKDDYLITPAVDNPTQLTFQYKRSGTATPTWTLDIDVSTNGGSNWTTVASYDDATTTCQQATVSLSAYAGTSNVLIRFTDSRANGNQQRYLDDVKVFCAGSCTPPTSNATSMVFSSVGSASMTVGFTAGSGTRHLVVANTNSGSLASFTPSNYTTYAANSDYTSATDLGSGNKAVFAGTGTSVTVTGLTGGTTYYYRVFEYNCSGGSEQYYTAGTELEGNQATLPAPATSLAVTCQTSSTADITWTLPEGNYTGVIVGVRQGSACENISGDASSYTASATFGSGTLIGAATRTVYKGTGTSVTVSNLTTAPYYVVVYTYLGNTSTIWSSSTMNPTTSITALGVPNVTSLTTSAGSSQVQVAWANPSGSCWDEVMVVGKQTSAVTASPSGDGTAYSANAAWTSGTAFDGGYVVYKGNGNGVTVTGLTNGTSYCFKVFTRSGTTWSSGVYECATPSASVTVFTPGDIAVFGVCSNTSACIGSQSGDDEISFVCFKDITVGTTLDMTDNGWEKCSAGTWGNTEGYMRIKRTTSTITKGTIITLRFNQTGAKMTGIYPDNNWTIEIEQGPLIFNSDGDQLYFMQGGTWNNGTLNSNNATYTGGNILFAFNTNSTWTSGICSTDNNSSGTGRSQNSGLIVGMECFNMVPNVATDYLEYAGDMSAKTQRDWIAYLKDGDNWNAYADCAEYEDNGYDYLNTDHSITISTSGSSYTPGLWTGAASTSWFECSNWDNLRVPDESVDVSLPSSGATNDCEIGAPPTGYTSAECKNLTNSLSGYEFYINNTSSKLDIWGNFTNDATFSHSAGLVTFKGTTAQSISGTGSTSFYNVTLNNSAGLTLNRNIDVTGTITLTSGVLTTQSSYTIDLGSAGSIVETTPSSLAPTSYVTGNVKATRNIGSSTNQLFGGLGLEINETATSGNSTIVTRTTGTSIVSGPGTSIKRYFDITPTTNTGLNGTLIFHYFDHEITGFTETDLEMFRSPSPYSVWTAQLATINTGGNTSTKTSIPAFSRWTLADKNHPLPVELLSFEAVCNGDQTILAWSTASETNNDYFKLERSINSVDWELIAKVDGAGNSNTLSTYSFSDENNGSIVYYRLTQVDYDGALTEFDPIMVECENVFTQINMYPNPANDQTICSLYSHAAISGMLEIQNSLGTVIYSKFIEASEGFNTITLDISAYKAGIYNVVIKSSDGVSLGYKKLIIY